MKFRISGPGPGDENEAERRLRATLAGRGYRAPDPLPDRIRSAMLVRTNERIDSATSARALSLSWAVRVAVPGVVAIVAFFIGLHYYTTPVTRTAEGLTPLLNELSDAALDSLLQVHAAVDSSSLLGDTPGEFLAITGELAAEYLLSTDRTDIVAETMDEEEMQAVLKAMTAGRTATF